jgi:hypothetical protein
MIEQPYSGETPEQIADKVRQMLVEVLNSFIGKPITQSTGEEIALVALARLEDMKYAGYFSPSCRLGTLNEIVNDGRNVRLTARYIPVWELEYKELWVTFEPEVTQVTSVQRINFPVK